MELNTLLLQYLQVGCDKSEVARKQQYENAAKLRDIEKKLIVQINDIFLKEKPELLIDRDGMERFDYNNIETSIRDYIGKILGYQIQKIKFEDCKVILRDFKLKVLLCQL